MGVSQSSTRLILWAAQDGRSADLLYHLQDVKAESLKGSSLAPHRRSAIHLAAERGRTECVKLLRQAGKAGMIKINLGLRGFVNDCPGDEPKLTSNNIVQESSLL